ncbi:MAG: 37S ribosomal protein S17 mitochondrial [Marteilia pararefringens]
MRRRITLRNKSIRLLTHPVTYKPIYKNVDEVFKRPQLDYYLVRVEGIQKVENERRQFFHDQLKEYASCRLNRPIYNPLLCKHFSQLSTINVEFDGFDIKCGDWLLVKQKLNKRADEVHFKCVIIVDQMGVVVDPHTGEKIEYIS